MLVSLIRHWFLNSLKPTDHAHPQSSAFRFLTIFNIGLFPLVFQPIQAWQPQLSFPKPLIIFLNLNLISYDWSDFLAGTITTYVRWMQSSGKENDPAYLERQMRLVWDAIKE